MSAPAHPGPGTAAGPGVTPAIVALQRAIQIFSIAAAAATASHGEHAPAAQQSAERCSLCPAEGGAGCDQQCVSASCAQQLHAGQALDAGNPRE